MLISLSSVTYFFTLHYQVHGLCGNNDGSTQSELALPNEVMMAGSVQEFAAAWIVNGGQCDAGHINPGPQDTCNIESQVKFSPCNYQYLYFQDYFN